MKHRRKEEPLRNMAAHFSVKIPAHYSVQINTIPAYRLCKVTQVLGTSGIEGCYEVKPEVAAALDLGPLFLTDEMETPLIHPGQPEWRVIKSASKVRPITLQSNAWLLDGDIHIVLDDPTAGAIGMVMRQSGAGLSGTLIRHRTLGDEGAQ